MGHLKKFASINKCSSSFGGCYITMAVKLNNFVVRHMAIAKAAKVHTAVNLFWRRHFFITFFIKTYLLKTTNT